MKYILILFLVLSLLFYSKQGFMTRANSYDVSKYASNTYPCFNEHKQAQHFQI